MNRLDGPNYYQILSVSEDSETSEIVQSYHSICKKFSIFPYATDDEINAINPDFIIYKKAYVTLSNIEKREVYDEQLKLLAEQQQRKSNSDYKKIISDTTDLKDIIPFAFGIQSIKENSFVEVKANINEYLFNKGKECFENGEYHEAINIFRKLINIKDEARYHSNLALVLDKKGWNAYAQEEFKLALDMDPQDPIALEYFENVRVTAEKAKTTTKLDPKDLENLKTKDSFFSKIKNIFNKKLI